MSSPFRKVGESALEGFLGGFTSGFTSSLQNSIQEYFEREKDQKYRSVVDQALQAAAEREGGDLKPESIVRTVSQLDVPERYKKEAMQTAQLISTLQSNDALIRSREVAQSRGQDVQEPDQEKIDNIVNNAWMYESVGEYLNDLKKAGVKSATELRIYAQGYKENSKEKDDFYKEQANPIKDKIKALEKQRAATQAPTAIKQIDAEINKQYENLDAWKKGWKQAFVETKIQPPQVPNPGDAIQLPQGPPAPGAPGAPGQSQLYNKLSSGAVNRAVEFLR